MPVTIESFARGPDIADLRERRLRRGSIRDRGRRLRIGLVNNMPDTALAATERQFKRLLDDAGDEFEIALSLWTLETLERGLETRQEIAATYRSGIALHARGLDAVIVTGAEPRAPNLRDEPYWRELAAIFDWAEAQTVSSLYSCLAAHAAVEHRDRVPRRRLSTKCSGVFAAEVVARHELIEGFGPGEQTPHSRFNGLEEGELAAKGYRTLTRASGAGVDMFVKEAGSLQVFLQGHPEYDGDTLAREYRRDVGRFLTGQRSDAPALPTNYYAPELASKLLAWLGEAMQATSVEAAARFPVEAVACRGAPWRATSRKLYRNWLRAVANRKGAVDQISLAVARWGG